MLLNLLAYLFLLLSSSHVEFEHEQLCVLKLIILLMEWKMEELSMKSTLSSSREELLIVFPVISLLSSPAKSVKAMVTRLLQILEHFLLDFKDIFEGDGSPCTDFSVMMEAESIPLRLLHYLFTELSVLEMLPSLASHPSMLQLIVQTILPMLHNDKKSSLCAVAIRVLCKIWVVSDRAFGTLQHVLSRKIVLNSGSMREICVSVAASVRDVCKHNPDRGVDLILSVSSCIESKDSLIKALGLQSLSSLCEADVVDFCTAWEVIAKHVNCHAVEPIVAAGLVAILRWGAMDVDAYPDVARRILQIL